MATSKSRKQIEDFAAMLEVKVVSLKWTPIGRGGEKEGPSGGWECEVEPGGDCYGYNADDLCHSMLVSVRGADMERYRRECYQLGVASAAKEKDGVIADLKRRLVTGNAAHAQRFVNEIKAEGIRDLLRAVYRSSASQPPMRDMWLLRDLAERHLGERWDHPELFVGRETPVVFEPMPEGERKKYWDSSPWKDLAVIRKAAGTEDTDEIVRRLAAVEPAPAH